jgi:hypothetical protein
MFKGQRIKRLEDDVKILRRNLEYYKDTKSDLQSEIRDSLNKELAVYRSRAEASVTDRIKFDVLEEWINEVFKLNGLKFTDSDFIKHNERGIIEAEIREQIAKEIEDYRLERAEELSISPAAFPRIQVALAKLVREPK